MSKIDLKKFSFKLLKTLPESEKRITFSTLVTMARIFLVPFIIWSMVTQHWGFAFWLFSIAAFTDTLDGNIARWFNQKTFLGACLDPIADKILLISVFTTLAFVQSPLFAIPIWFVVLVLVKDMIIIAGSTTIFVSKKHLDVAPTILGKLTTLMQICFIIWLFACYFFSWMPVKTYFFSLFVVSICVIATLVQYVWIGFKQFMADI